MASDDPQDGGNPRPRPGPGRRRARRSDATSVVHPQPVSPLQDHEVSWLAEFAQQSLTQVPARTVMRWPKCGSRLTALLGFGGLRIRFARLTHRGVAQTSLRQVPDQAGSGIEAPNIRPRSLTRRPGQRFRSKRPERRTDLPTEIQRSERRGRPWGQLTGESGSRSSMGPHSLMAISRLWKP